MPLPVQTVRLGRSVDPHVRRGWPAGAAWSAVVVRVGGLRRSPWAPLGWERLSFGALLPSESPVVLVGVGRWPGPPDPDAWSWGGSCDVVGASGPWLVGRGCGSTVGVGAVVGRCVVVCGISARPLVAGVVLALSWFSTPRALVGAVCRSWRSVMLAPPPWWCSGGGCLGWWWRRLLSCGPFGCTVLSWVGWGGGP